MRPSGGPVTSRPSSTTEPAVGRISPATHCSSVDLPQPDGPTMETNWCASTRKLTSPSAMTGAPDNGWNSFLTPRTSSMATAFRLAGIAPRLPAPAEYRCRIRVSVWSVYLSTKGARMSVRSIMASAWAAAIVALAPGPALPAFDADPLEELAMGNMDFGRGRAAVEARDWNDAIRWLTAADKRTPNHAEIHNLLGYAYRNAGQIETALKHYQRALQISPRHRGAHEYIGEAYLLSRNPAKAEEHLAELKRICPILCPERNDLSRKIAAYKAVAR